MIIKDERLSLPLRLLLTPSNKNRLAMGKQPLTRVQRLLDKIKSIPVDEESEPTIFSIGSRGYYENPTTDILAFFCNTNAAHGLDDLVLNALLSCSDQLQSLDSMLIESPQREVVTSTGKRIDLLLESQEWVIVLENKVFHQQNNPFEDYESFIKGGLHQGRFEGKKAIFVVLSPTGTVEQANWVGVSYPQLILSIKQQLADHFLNKPLNKWTVLLREFLLHLESIMAKPSLSKESIDFVLDNLSEFKAAQRLQEKAIKAYQQSLLQELQSTLGRNLRTTIHTWHGYPAIRFSYENWGNESDVVLFLDGRATKSFCINYYSADINTDDKRVIADKHFKEDDTGKPWNEIKETFRCYKARFTSLDYDSITNKLAHKLKLMDSFETDIRPSLKGEFA
ncbi:PD-(D/E)XK nuclease family protein [Vibrio diabolicus]|uniref:PD-(D/E)XK nuclease family protein n=1 Tax=Vibrio diabolicus TaxID=50719 RepID=UPI0037528C33